MLLAMPDHLGAVLCSVAIGNGPPRVSRRACGDQRDGHPATDDSQAAIRGRSSSVQGSTLSRRASTK